MDGPEIWVGLPNEFRVRLVVYPRAFVIVRVVVVEYVIPNALNFHWTLALKNPNQISVARLDPSYVSLVHLPPPVWSVISESLLETYVYCSVLTPIASTNWNRFPDPSYM